MQKSLADRELVLVGAGHTNAHILRMWKMRPIPGVRLTVVSSYSRATYSGMLPGTLAGLYQPEQMEIDLHRLCAATGARLIVAPAAGLDPDRREILFADRAPIPYDFVSIGIGSVPGQADIWRSHPDVLSIKPMPTFLPRLDARIAARTGTTAVFTGDLQDDSRSSDATDAEPSNRASTDRPDSERRGTGTRPLQVAVVGGGAAGVEIAFCLESHLRTRGLTARMHLVDSGPQILAGYRNRTRQLALREFTRRGIDVLPDRTVVDFQNGQLIFADEERLPADLVIWATRASYPPELAGFDLPRTDDGFLAVRDTLQSPADDRVFVVGDTATFLQQDVPKAGVYAVREGPVLWENLQRAFAGRPLRSFAPQKGFLSLLATGDGRAIGQYKWWSFHSHWAWKLKDLIDARFMEKHEDFRPMDPAAASNSHAGAPPVMRCRGCGGKVGADILASVLDRLAAEEAEHDSGVITAPSVLRHRDDAAVIPPPDDRVEIVTVDFFQSFLDDSWLVGRIAALNALSDIWAMGAEPTFATAIAMLPPGIPQRQSDELYQLLAGGLRELKAAGAQLVGGHTIDAEAITIGYTVCGRLNGQQPFRKEHAREGDRLVLTRPVGTGVLLAGQMQARTRSRWMDHMLELMLQSNAAAARIARVHGIRAATDVTGFGLAGHLLEMLQASGVGATLDLQSVPVLPGFEELHRAGIASTLAPSNHAAAIHIDSDDPPTEDNHRWAALFDPQTSGGLLLAVPAERTGALLHQLHAEGITEATCIGEITSSAKDGSTARIRLRR